MYSIASNMAKQILKWWSLLWQTSRRVESVKDSPKTISARDFNLSKILCMGNSLSLMERLFQLTNWIWSRESWRMWQLQFLFNTVKIQLYHLTACNCLNSWELLSWDLLKDHALFLTLRSKKFSHKEKVQVRLKNTWWASSSSQMLHTLLTHYSSRFKKISTPWVAS